MTWIATVSFDDATGPLRRLYDRIKGPDNNVDNIMLAHSLRPHTMEGHMGLYKHVLHNSRNELPKHFLETVGVYVSSLNRCDYCLEHHFTGLSRLLSDPDRAANIRAALEADRPGDAFADKELAGLVYARRLTLEPATMAQEHVAALLASGFDDGEVLELNQVAAYFSYANRTVLGLGVSTDGDIIGLSPGDSDDPDNWQHS